MNPGDLHPTIAPITGGGSTTQLGEVRSPYWAVGRSYFIVVMGCNKRAQTPPAADMAGTRIASM
jgi:hypothetical protein